MNAEKKQALAETASEDIKFLENVRERRGHLFEIEEQKLSLMKIALTALNAQPVKLPKIKHPAQFDYADEVVLVLKSHGYEVQE